MRLHDGHRDLDRLVHAASVADADGDVGAPRGHARGVLDRGAPHLRVRDGYEHVVGRQEFRCHDADGFHFAGLPVDGDDLVDIDRPEGGDPRSGRDVVDRVGHTEAHNEACHGGEAHEYGADCHPERAQHHEDDKHVEERAQEPGQELDQDVRELCLAHGAPEEPQDDPGNDDPDDQRDHGGQKLHQGDTRKRQGCIQTHGDLLALWRTGCEERRALAERWRFGLPLFGMSDGISRRSGGCQAGSPGPQLP